MNQQLSDLYLKASYVIDDKGVNLMIRLDDRNEELHNLLRERGSVSWAFMTAYNPRSEPTPDPKNIQRQAELIRMLNEKGYKYLHGYGSGDNWEHEPSLFVLDIDRDAAIDIGTIFEQNAILWASRDSQPELIWTNRLQWIQ